MCFSYQEKIFLFSALACGKWLKAQAADLSKPFYAFYKASDCSVTIGTAPLNDEWQYVWETALDPRKAPDRLSREIGEEVIARMVAGNA